MIGLCEPFDKLNQINYKQDQNSNQVFPEITLKRSTLSESKHDKTLSKQEESEPPTKKKVLKKVSS